MCTRAKGKAPCSVREGDGTVFPYGILHGCDAFRETAVIAVAGEYCIFPTISMLTLCYDIV